MVDDEVEGRLLELFLRDDRQEFATLAVQTYAPEVYGFLSHVLDEAPSAADVLSQVVEAFWRSLPEFRAECSVRTWLYLLARRAVRRYKRPTLQSQATYRGSPPHRSCCICAQPDRTVATDGNQDQVSRAPGQAESGGS